MAARIILKPQGPADQPPGALEELGSVIRALDLTYTVLIIPPGESRGRGLTYWQVLHVWIGEAATTLAVTELVKVCVRWAKRWFQRHETDRPQYIAIYGLNGEVIKSVLVKQGQRRVEDHTERAREQESRRLPPRVD